MSNLLKQWEMKTTVHLRPYPYINTNYFVAANEGAPERSFFVKPNFHCEIELNRFECEGFINVSSTYSMI